MIRMCAIIVIVAIPVLAACSVVVESDDKNKTTKEIDVARPPDTILECWRHNEWMVCRPKSES